MYPVLCICLRGISINITRNVDFKLNGSTYFFRFIWNLIL